MTLPALSFPILYDVSWTLHRLQWPSQSNAPFALLSLSNPRNRNNRAKQMQEFLHIDEAGPEADNAFDEKVGAIKKVKWEVLEDVRDLDVEEDLDDGGRTGGYVHMNGSRGGRAAGNGNEVGSGIVVTLTYEAAEYRVILYGPAPGSASASDHALPLLLTKTPPLLSKRIFTFLLDTFDIRMSPFKVPDILLRQALESYIQILYKAISTFSGLRKTAFLSATLQDVKITLSFRPPVAPHLRSIDFDIQTDTVCNMIDTAVTNKVDFTQVLDSHINHYTAMQMDLPSAQGNEGSNTPEPEPLMWISKIVCNAFAISGDGRFKLVDKACRAADIDNLGTVVREANNMLLGRLLAQAVQP